MVLAVLVALFLLVITWLIHSYHYCTKRTCRRDCGTFNFFPISFLCYLTFVILLSIFIIAIDITNHFNHTFNTNDLTLDLFLDYSFQSTLTTITHHYGNINADSFMELRSIKTTHIMDYILIYAVMIISVWNSFFLCYIHYLTLSSLNELKIISTRKILSIFSMYGVVFCMTFVAQIHFYYWVYPLSIIYSFATNLYWAKRFSSLLMSHLSEIENSGCFVSDLPQLKSMIKFKKRILFTCCILFAISLSPLLVTYNVDIIYYLPIVWSVTACVFSLTFARNYQFLSQRCGSCKCTQREELPHKPKGRVASPTEPVISPAENKDVATPTPSSICDIKTTPISEIAETPVSPVTPRHLIVPHAFELQCGAQTPDASGFERRTDDEIRISMTALSMETSDEYSYSSKREPQPKMMINVSNIDAGNRHRPSLSHANRFKSAPVYGTDNVLSPFKFLAQYGLYCEKSLPTPKDNRRAGLKRSSSTFR
eukprot:171057_1